MKKRLVGYLLITFLVLSIFVPTSSSDEEVTWWNNSWEFRQEVIIPFDTHMQYAECQPIDITVNFDNPCWAKNETHYSIRVIYQYSVTAIELDSQIYDLEHIDEDTISSCNLVFLIPEKANPEARYFIYYDSESKPAPDYEDHVDIEDTDFYYEPIQGISLSTKFFKITEDNKLIYGVSYEGTAYNEKVIHETSKFKIGSESLKPNNGEQIASFYFTYWWYKEGCSEAESINSNEKLVSKKIICDGNLMVKCGIESQSNEGHLKTKVIYKYYYNPCEEKKIYANVKHEFGKYPLPQGDAMNLGFAMLRSGGIKSSTIKELNFGRIYPYLHLYNDDERIITFDIDTNPESTNWLKIIGNKDDVDLGSSAWLSVDEGETGKAHGLLFDSPNIIVNGEEERQGIQINLYQANIVNVPGIDALGSYLYFMRNGYEEGQPSDEVVPEDLKIEFNAEFFSTEEGGYKRVEKEASIYQKLISQQPDEEEDLSDGDEITEKYNLTVFAHLSPNLIFKMFGSKFLLKDSHISAELYSEGELKGFGRLSRFSFDEKSLIDFKNISLFRKIRFTDRDAGRYLVKLYIENAGLLDSKKFVGYQIFELSENTNLRIYCRPEGKIIINSKNQNSLPIQDLKAEIIDQDTVISSATSNKDGNIELGAPCGYGQSYLLKTMYKGFQISEEEIKFGPLRQMFTLKKQIDFDVYDYSVKIIESEKSSPDFDVDISLTSSEMQEPIIIRPDSNSDGVYKFSNLYPGTYSMNLKFNQFDINEIIRITKTSEKEIKLYDFTAYLRDKLDLAPDATLDIYLASNDLEKEIYLPGQKISNKKYVFTDLYPGNYTFTVEYKSFILQRQVHIPNGETHWLFPAEYNVSFSVYDTHGSPLSNAIVKLLRQNVSLQSNTDESGKVVFLVPPGTYDVQIQLNDEIIAFRQVHIVNEKPISIVTENEPIIPYAVIGISIIVALAFAFISYKRFDLATFTKILAILLVIVSFVSPWWVLYGSMSNPEIETSSTLYLEPMQIVTITKTDTVVAGELATVDELFYNVLSLIPIISIIGCLLIIGSIILEKIRRTRLSKVSYFAGFLSIGVAVAVFYFAIREFSFILYGSLIGEGEIDVNIPGTESYHLITCVWRVDIGFYLMLASVILLGLIIFVKIIKWYSNNRRNQK